MNTATGPYYIGVDVGTGSARAAVVDQAGSILGLSEKPIVRHELKPNHITQSTTEIWEAICFCVRLAVSQAGINPAFVHGIGFDATCSLVALDTRNNQPMAVGPNFADDNQNVILWMDHRAQTQVDAINATNDVCLKYVGGAMSIEMEMPKIKWLKENVAPVVFRHMKFYDLPDFLTHRATGSEARSYCSVVCKQGFVPPGVDGSKYGWSQTFLERIGLGELAEANFKRLGGAPGLGGRFLSTGETVGTLSEVAASELGLSPECRVGSAVIDAYAGWIGTVAARDSQAPALATPSRMEDACGRLAAVAGTLTCHIVMSPLAVFVPGIWGPYRDALSLGYWLAEGGQSCTGALLAHVLATHPAYAELATAADDSGLSKFDFLNARLELMVKETGARSVVALAKHLFFYGDYHGNRSPVADSRMRASIIGQSMDVSLNDLALTYFGACEFIAQQTRQIVEVMTRAGHSISRIYMSGGQCRNGLLMRLLADCTGLPIIIPRYIDAAVVCGAAMLGAVAAQGLTKGLLKSTQFTASVAKSPYTAPSATSSYTALADLAQPSQGFPFPVAKPSKEVGDEALTFKTTSTRVSDTLWKVMERMSGTGKTVFPNSEQDPDRVLLDAKYQIFLDMCAKQQEYRAAIDAVESLLMAGSIGSC